ncbi:MAG: NAD(+)/NADH kinase, partial [bacterium]|nr:NAD(+)/NADH kinase [bacterium]
FDIRISNFMNKIGIIANINKPQIKEIVPELCEYLETKKKKRVLLEEELAKKLKIKRTGVPLPELANRAELIIVLGGDGTLLYAARMRALGSCPVLGVNLGSLGFLASVSLPELYSTLDQIWRNQYRLEPRMMLEASISIKTAKFYPPKFQRRWTTIRNPQLKSYLALNDVVVTKEALSRIIELTISTNGQFVVRYQADGLIISTPTGSTAHSLSAGGPIVEPKLKAIMITPICPHTLSNRPLIISAQDTVEIEVQTPDQPVYLTLDGQQGLPISPDQTIRVKRAKETVNLIVPPQKNYYEVLRTKLHWGGR